jgi:hypothetical protein
MTQGAVKERHLRNRMVDSLEGLRHIEDLVAESRVEDMNNGTNSMEQPMKAHEPLQQTYGMDALQNRLAYGSCCYSPLEGSRNFAVKRTEHLAATAHSRAGRHD